MPMEMILLPGFRDDFDAMPDEPRAEFKDNCRTDQIGRLVNGKFTQRLRGRRLTEVRTYECLVGMKKMYLDHAQYRVIFQQSGNAVVLIAAGERRDMLVYKRARDRVQRLIAQQSQSTPQILATTSHTAITRPHYGPNFPTHMRADPGNPLQHAQDIGANWTP